MRRISRNWDELATQLNQAANGINAEPNWPGSAPSKSDVQAARDAIRSTQMQIIAAENTLQGLRTEFEKAMENGSRLMRLVDYTIQGIYPQGDPALVRFGLRPIDRTRNSPGPTPRVEKLILADGLAPGSIHARWKTVPRATFEIQWFSDDSLSTLVGAMVSTRREATIPALPLGLQIWVRVRAFRGRKYGEWSDVASRIANV